MAEQLKPCPFCGGEAHLDRHDIFCDCGAKMPIPMYTWENEDTDTLPCYETARKEMIEAWNSRV